MKKVAVQEAIGMEICHDITAMRDGFKGPAFRRGHVIREEDVEELLNIGKKHVFVWEENTGELHEEDCARRMAAMAPVEGAHYTEPSEGKVLLIADRRGMFRVDTEMLREINSIGDITISTLPDHYPVEAGTRLASMRIVPLVTKEEQILQAEALCREKKLLDLKPYLPHKIGVIITGSEVYSGRIQDKFEPVIRRKMKQYDYPAEIVGVTICDDDTDMIVQAAQAHLAAGADILLFTGGMSVDPDDITPAAIRSLGADIITHGVPSQPGNMTLVAYLDKSAADTSSGNVLAANDAATDVFGTGNVTILGVPGAAISMPTTILDVLLPALFAGEKITKEDLVRLGDGGLCQLCPNCHFPNCTFGRY